MKPTLLLVDDSELVLSELSLILRESGIFSGIFKARDGEDAIRTTLKEKPKLIVLDLQMPRMDGFTFLRWLMTNHPVPVVVFSSQGTDDNIFRAMEIGAVDFITKPDTYIDDTFRTYLLDKMRIALEANVQPTRQPRTQPVVLPGRDKAVQPSGHDIQAIAIGASTGGPTAIQRLLESIQNTISVPILVCQHMPRAFTSVFAQRLNMLLDYHVKEAEDHDILSNGTVYVCPGNRHMEVVEGKIHLHDSAQSDRYTPSVDRLFFSASASFKEKLIAIVLTGMGKDGSEGVKRVAKTGGSVIAESAETSVIHGMPKAAIATGCGAEVIPLDRIGARIIDLASGA